MERSPMWFDPKGEGRETPGVTNQGKIWKEGLEIKVKEICFLLV